MEKKWYQEKRRRTLLDVHIEDWDPTFMTQFDPEAYYNALVTANINAPMIYLQSHVGLCYWPTKSGKMHNGLKGKENTMKYLFDLCHNGGMSVIAYYSIIFNNWAHQNHPAWRMIDARGYHARTTGARYGLVCPNNQEYRNFISRQVGEICDLFDFEGFFFDMTYWPMVCFCDSCRTRWEEEVGGEMPRYVDWNNDRWNLFQQKRVDWLGEFAQFCTDEVKKRKPTCSVEHQYSKTYSFWRFGNNENITKASDYIGTDLYGGVEQQSFACKTWYNLTQNQPFQYMTSRCYPNLHEHTTMKSLDQLHICTMLTYMHHGASLLIDGIDPVGTFDPNVYKNIGVVFRELEKYEPYFTRGKMSYSVGLYLNQNGKMNVEKNCIALSNPTVYDDSSPHMTALYGAGLSLRKHKIPYGVINNWKLEEQIKGLQVVVLPDAPNISKHEIDIFIDYVKNGGNLYMSAHSDPILLKEFFGAKWEGITYDTITYITPQGDLPPLEKQCSKKYPLVMFEQAVKVSGVSKDKVVATITLCYTPPSPHGIRTFDDPFIAISDVDPRYPFSTIHANPPGKETSYPAMMRTAYGKGQVIWSALAIEKHNRAQHSDAFADIITMLAGENGLVSGAEGPDPIECILFEDIDEKQKIMGVINVQEDFHTIPACGVKVWVKSDTEPRSVFLLPDKEPLLYRYEHNKVVVEFEKIKYYSAFVLQY
jgi:hypothetical protein